MAKRPKAEEPEGAEAPKISEAAEAPKVQLSGRELVGGALWDVLRGGEAAADAIVTGQYDPSLTELYETALRHAPEMLEPIRARFELLGIPAAAVPELTAAHPEPRAWRGWVTK